VRDWNGRIAFNNRRQCNAFTFQMYERLGLPEGA
jgi:hypothetical protein